MRLDDKLRSVDLSGPGRWPPSVRAVAITLALAAVLVLGVRILGVDADYALLESARREEAELRSRFEQAQRRAASLTAYREQLDEIGDSYGRQPGRLSATTEIPGMLADISQAGINAGLEERLFQPMEEQRREFHVELPINLSLSGDYHQLGRFVGEVSAMPRLVTLHDLRIRRLDGGGPGDLLMDVTAMTYRQLEEGEGSP